MQSTKPGNVAEQVGILEIHQPPESTQALRRCCHSTPFDQPQMHDHPPAVQKMMGRVKRFAQFIHLRHQAAQHPPQHRSQPIAPPSASVQPPLTELDRLRVLQQYNLLDTAPEAEFDDLTALAAYICGSPMSLLSLTDASRQWFKSTLGLTVSEIPRELSFCSHAIQNPDALMIVPDALADDRFATNPLVTAAPNIRFYAGAPLVTPDGYPLGTLCVLDRTPRQLTPAQQQALQALSRQAIAQMELRLTATKLERQILRYQQTEAKLRASDQQVVDLLEGISDGFFALDRQGRCTFVNRRATQILRRSAETLLGRVIWQTLEEVLGSRFEREHHNAVDRQISISFEQFSHTLGRWIEIRTFPSYEGLSVFLHDVTDRRIVDEALRYQQEQTEELLLNVLPQLVAERLKLGDGIVADSFAEATILFADLVDFTPLASQVSPDELVSLLNGVFSAFERLTEKYGLEKIKTIGDAYLVVGGVPTPRPDHATAIASMALEMQEVIQQFRTPLGDRLRLSIGINTGAVVAGVIGTKKFSYALWGDTVNIASRMQTHRLAGSIQVTETTYQQLQDDYWLEERGVISLKGRGEMKAYLLMGKKDMAKRMASTPG